MKKEPEKLENFGITVVEVMSFGAVPVIIDKGGHKETVDHEDNGYRWTTSEKCVKYTHELIHDK